MMIQKRLGIAITAGLLALAPAAFAGHHEGGGKNSEKHAEKAREEAKGRSNEMRERRDERKAIMEEAKGEAEPGTPRRGKKPWWRFWDSEAAAE